MSSLSLLFIVASTSGHTQYVVERVTESIQKNTSYTPRIVRAEHAAIDDLLSADVLIFASGTWNTNGKEGQLNPHMHAFFEERCKEIDLTGKKMACISLGDDRYYFTTRCTEHFFAFQKRTHLTSLCMPLVIVNEPYDQHERIDAWTKKFVTTVQSVTPLLHS